MASEDELERLRTELNERINSVSVDLMGAFGSLDNHGRRFDEIDRRFAEVDRRFRDMDRRFDLMDVRFDQMDTRFDRMDSRIESLDTKIDSRFGWQTFLIVALGVVTVLNDQVGQILGL